MHYWQVWGGDAKPVEAYIDVKTRFLSEYGLQSFPDMRTIRSFAGPQDMDPESPVMRAHQKYDKGNGNRRLLLYIRREFGEPKDFESFVYLSQLMQAEGIGLAASHLRASRPQAMGSLYWQLNDVWPGASWSSVDYYGRWKALNYHARRFYAPELAAALRKDGKTRLALVSDRTAPLSARWRLRVLDFNGKELSRREKAVTLPPLSSTRVGEFSDAQLLGRADPKRSFAVFELLDGERRVQSRQLVFFDAAKKLSLPTPQVRSEWKADGDGFALTLSSDTLARDVWLSFGDLDVSVADNAFDLLPGEPQTVRVQGQATLEQLRAALQVRELAGTLAGAPAEPKEAQ
jgi:beta-mannosidase